LCAVSNEIVSRLVPIALVGLSLAGVGAQSNAPASDRPAFEVASVKPNKSRDAGRGSFVPRVDRFTQTNVTLRQLVQRAYARRAFDTRQIVGGPGWIDSDRFDIIAKIEDGAGSLLALYVPDGKDSPGLAYLMLRTLLEDRFKLAVHSETRDLPIYTLMLARNDGRLGPKLVPSDIDCDRALKEQADALKKTGRPLPVPSGQGPPCSRGGTPGKFIGNDISMLWLADALTEFVNRANPGSRSVTRVVVNRTGLTGNFDMTLEWTPDELSTDTPGGSIFTALQEQLGLKLVPSRGPVDVLVVDRAERPGPD
jgi:uncharacterized protein (TIGR03435 family)